MPHITLDYSAHLAGRFDRAALVKELHALVSEDSGSAGVCKTLCRPVDETFAGEAAGSFSFVHVDIGLLPGRSEPVKARLSEDVLELVGRHLRAAGEDGAVRSVEVRELAASYRLSPGGPAVAPRCPEREDTSTAQA